MHAVLSGVGQNPCAVPQVRVQGEFVLGRQHCNHLTVSRRQLLLSSGPQEQAHKLKVTNIGRGMVHILHTAKSPKPIGEGDSDYFQPLLKDQPEYMQQGDRIRILDSNTRSILADWALELQSQPVFELPSQPVSTESCSMRSSLAQTCLPQLSSAQPLSPQQDALQPRSAPPCSAVGSIAPSISLQEELSTALTSAVAQVLCRNNLSRFCVPSQEVTKYGLQWHLQQAKAILDQNCEPISGASLVQLRWNIEQAIISASGVAKVKNHDSNASQSRPSDASQSRLSITSYTSQLVDNPAVAPHTLSPITSSESTNEASNFVDENTSMNANSLMQNVERPKHRSSVVKSEYALRKSLHRKSESTPKKAASLTLGVTHSFANCGCIVICASDLGEQCKDENLLGSTYYLLSDAELLYRERLPGLSVMMESQLSGCTRDFVSEKLIGATGAVTAVYIPSPPEAALSSICEADSQVMGAITFKVCGRKDSHNCHGSFAEILTCAAAKKRCGVGRLLVSWTMLAACTLGVDFVLVSAGADVLNFWERMGFVDPCSAGASPEVVRASTGLQGQFDGARVLFRMVSKGAFDSLEADLEGASSSCGAKRRRRDLNV